MFRLILPLLMATTLFASPVSYTYDAAGRLIRVDAPSGASMAYTYDAAGNLLSRTVTAPAGAPVTKKPTRRKETPRATRTVESVSPLRRRTFVKHSRPRFVRTE